MSDRNIPSESSRTLSDRQIDELLAAFFRHEVPSQLAEPSSGLLGTDAAGPALLVATDAPAETRRSSLRNITAVTGMLAACMVVAMAGWHMSMTPERLDSTVTDKQPSSSDSELMDVSTNPGSESAVDDTNTSLQEIDQIDLSPEADKPRQTP